jgi:molecular chaperone DnaK (HSP70)
LHDVASRHAEKVDSLVIGIPSIADTGTDEYRNAEAHRRDALALSGVEEALGSRQFTVRLQGEAMAAAYTVEPPEQSTVARVLIVDVGAGTSDLSLVQLEKEAGRRWAPVAELCRASVRLAGRDINVGIAKALRANIDMKRAQEAMDPRAVQWYLDSEVEHIKRSCTNQEQWYTVNFSEFATHPDGPGGARPKHDALKKSVPFLLSLYDIDWMFCHIFQPWVAVVTAFAEEAKMVLAASKVSKPDGIELVGGAFRFAPLRQLAEQVLTGVFGGDVPISYRDADGLEAQTTVARGLARSAAFD